MAKTYIAQNIANLDNIRFVVDGGGNITELHVSAEVNYGTMGMSESGNIWPGLNTAQKAEAQTFYNRVMAYLQVTYID